jgi:hypothetical protein
VKLRTVDSRGIEGLIRGPYCAASCIPTHFFFWRWYAFYICLDPAPCRCITLTAWRLSVFGHSRWRWLSPYHRLLQAACNEHRCTKTLKDVTLCYISLENQRLGLYNNVKQANGEGEIVTSGSMPETLRKWGLRLWLLGP